MTLQRLNRHLPFVSTCKICGAGAYLFDVVDFNKLCSQSEPYAYGLSGTPVYYLRCSECRFIFTSHCDQWSSDKFRDEIYNDDYEKVDGEYANIRPKRMADEFTRVFTSLDAPILDYGSGSSAFERELRERGFTNIVSFDPFSSPSRPNMKFSVITCFEVMEHAPDPKSTIADMLSFALPDAMVVFTTMLQPDDIDLHRGACWYIAPRNGHVSFYSEESLTYLARLHGGTFLRADGFHLMEIGAPPKSLVVPSYPVLSMLLSPPLTASKEWHGIETGERGAQFRWTARKTITWPIEPIARASIIKVRIPYVSQIAPTFISESTITIADTRAKHIVTRVGNSNFIEATATIQPHNGPMIRLETPPLISPRLQRGSPDSRHLGIAIPVTS